MKKLFYIIPFIITTSFANELSWVDEQIEAIKPSRVGVSLKEISRLKDPFIFLHRGKKDEEKEIKLNKKSVVITKTTSTPVIKKVHKGLFLEAILNKSALINGKWYKVGDEVYGYKILSIEAKSVELKKNKKRKILTTKSKKTNLKFSK